ncbi:hypothetical protein PS645_04937 [Pseudomonas fluorescens]|uniref:Uncharacterized protein n=1 Tax=Pseudomonas fluorescens TaxID=294 RepID=A0A5E6WX45_PSEFL|nr:hypothetical protein PS645_04937 [Pseudomonas fluorescens]
MGMKCSLAVLFAWALWPYMTMQAAVSDFVVRGLAPVGLRSSP